MPKRQQTVKIEPFDGLDRAPFVQPASKPGKPGGFERGRSGSVQEREVAETPMQLVIAHRQFVIDILFLRQPGNAGSLVAELIE